MRAGGNIVELHGDAHAVAALAYAAVDDIADAEFLGDLLQRYRFPLVGEGRVARDDEEPAHFGQCGDDVLTDAVGKILLRRVIAHVGEGEHGDRGPIERRQGRRARLAPRGRCRCRCVAPRLAIDIADKPDAPARDGADQFLLRGAVADGLARGVDAAGKGRIRNRPAAPDRGEEIVLADDALAIFQKVGQDVEYLRFDVNRRAAAPQLAAVGIKRMIGKEKLHSFPPGATVSSNENQVHLRGK